MTDPHKINWKLVLAETSKTLIKGLSIVVLVTSALLLALGSWLHKCVTVKGST